ncbi:glycosyltransferase [Patescibacteria group bacterium]|nr:glycosyltransferase [Patescibacteria group bacterium]
MEKSLISNGIKVAIVADFLVNFGGAEKVVQVLAEIFPDAPIYTLLYHPRLDKFFPGKKIIVSPLQRWFRAFNIPTKFLFPWMAGAVESFNFSGYDLVISSNNSFAGGIITEPETVHISYCHSPTRYLWDTYHNYIAEQRLPEFGKTIVKNILHNLRIWDKLSAGRVNVYIANSAHVQKRIRKYYRRDSTIIYPPVDTNKITPKKSNAGYFLMLSRLSSYKRVDLAIQACNTLKLPLVIIGEGEARRNLERLAGPTVEFLGWQEEKNKLEYLKNARALLFPGEDDFGIVPVEAMAAGKPVIAYGKGGALESIVAGKTGLFFDELTAESLTVAIRRFLTMEKKFDWRAISQHAQKFSVEKFKNDIMVLVDKYARHPERSRGT